MSDERGTSDDSTRFTARPGASDETRFTGVGAPPAGVGAPPPGGSPSHTTFPPGSLIGHTYRIEALLARGGMGEVYRARHVELNTDHALKIILPELANNQRIVDLFRREASVLRTIRHDAVVAYDGVSRDENGRLYLVMEFVDGPSLSKLMGNRTFTAEEVRQLRDRLADGLAVAHEKGVIHRDISPDNVILPGGDVDKAKIIDFGISKMADPEQKTIVGDDFAGKFSYVSPEQLGMFDGKVDGRSDIYSLGLVLVAAAQGEALDMGQSPISVIEARRAVPDLSRVPAAVRADLAAMLQPDPAKRPQSMREMIRPLDQRGGRRSTLSEASPKSSATKPGSGRSRAIVGALAVVVVAGGAFGYWYWDNHRGSDDGNGKTQQVDNGVKQGGDTGAANTGIADSSSTTSQGTQQSSTSTTTGQTQTTTGSTAGEGTGAGATGTQQQETGGGATSSSTGATVADNGQTSVSNTTNDGQAVGTTQNDSGATSNDATSNASTATTTSDSSGATGAGTAVTTTQTALLSAPDIEKLRTRARDAVGNLACASVNVAVSERGDMAASGYVGSEADRAKAVAALTALPRVGRVDNAIEVRTWPLCEVSSVVSGAAIDVGGPSAPRIDPGGPYHEGKDPLNLTVTPLRDGYLYVDYVDAANPDPKQRYVLHLLPSPLRDPNNYVKAGESVVIGSLPKEKGYIFNPPLGANMVLVVLSPERLFQKERPKQEEDGDEAGAYLAALRAALTAVAQRSGPGKLLVGTSSLTFVTE